MMKAVVLLAIMLQYQAEAGVMARVERAMAADGASCTGPSMGVNFFAVDECFDMGSTADVKITCSGVNAVATAYTKGNGCTTVLETKNGQGWVNGVHDQQGACYNSSENAANEFSKMTCAAVDTVTSTRYSDTSCGTAMASGTSGAVGTTVVGECVYSYKKDSNDNFLFGQIDYALKMEKASNGSLVVSSYTDTRCVGGQTYMGQYPANTCFQGPMMDGSGSYEKSDNTVSLKADTPVGNTVIVPGSGGNTSDGSNTTAVASTSDTRLQQGLSIPISMLAFLLGASALSSLL